MLQRAAYDKDRCAPSRPRFPTAASAHFVQECQDQVDRKSTIAYHRDVAGDKIRLHAVWFAGFDPQTLYPWSLLFLLESRQIEWLLFAVKHPPPPVLQAVQVVDLTDLRPDEVQVAFLSALVEPL